MKTKIQSIHYLGKKQLIRTTYSLLTELSASSITISYYSKDRKLKANALKLT